MRQQNTSNPICPRCRYRLRRNGFKNGKLRLRCRCGYNDTENSTAHNANKRLLIHDYFDMLIRERKGESFHTYPSYTQLKNEKKLVRTLNGQGSTGVLFGSLQAKTERLNRETPSGYVPLEKNTNKTVQRETPNTLS